MNLHKKKLIHLLKAHLDIFAWDMNDVPGVDLFITTEFKTGEAKKEANRAREKKVCKGRGLEIVRCRNNKAD